MKASWLFLHLLCVLTIRFLPAARAEQPAYSNIIPQLFTFNYPTAVASGISRQCVSDSRAFAAALLKREQWALTMFEASGKFPESGGQIYDLQKTHSTGLFDECLTVEAKWTDTAFQGKYCTAMFSLEAVKPYEIDPNSTERISYNNWVAAYQLPQWFAGDNIAIGPRLKKPKKKIFSDSGSFLPFSLPSIGYCIPSSCSGADFASSLAQLVGKSAVGNVTVDGKSHHASVVTIAGDNYCYTRDMMDAAPNFDASSITFITILSLLGLVILMGTFYDAWRQFIDQPIEPRMENRFVGILHCFSVLNSGKKILSTKIRSRDLSCVHGIRFLSTTWIVMLHVNSASVYRDSYNKFSVKEENLDWKTQGIANSLHSVDTFFLLSGLLVAYGLLLELERNKGRFNVLLFYVHRYLRLTPVYAIILGFIATLLVHVGTGPHWQIVRDMGDSCKSNWWTNLLYVNNYKSVRADPKQCMFEAWYLACNMQMFWLSPLLIYPLWRWWKAGVTWVIAVITGLTSASVAVYVLWILPPTDMSSTRPSFSPKVSYYSSYYLQTWARFPPYMVGILVGWLLHKTRNSEVSMNRILVAVGWFLATAVGLAVLYGLLPYLSEEIVPEINPVVSVAYGSLHRLAWATAVGWVIFACIHGYGGFVNRLLSWKVFLPLGRLTYVAYLFHWNFIKVHMYYSRKPFYYSTLDQTINHVAIVAFTFLASFIISLLVETPLLSLERLLISGRKSHKPKEAAERDEDVEMLFINGNKVDNAAH